MVILGFDDLVSIIESKYGSEEKMRDEFGLSEQADQIYTVIPQIQAKIQEIKKNVESKDLNALKANFDKRFAFYRDKDGKSPLHTAVEKGFFEIAIYLLESCPLLSKINDCVIIIYFATYYFIFHY